MADNFDTDDSPTRRFNVDKYASAPEGGPPGQALGGQLRVPIAPYIDAADALANNRQMVVSVRHEASGKEVFFKAFITAFNETYNSDWSRESVFGRVDPIQLFRSTERKITLALKVPGATEGEAYENLGRLQLLTQFLYPTYLDDGASAQLMGQSPLVRLKVMNLIRTNKNDEPAVDMYANRESFNNYKSDLGASAGLLGTINSLQINHNLENPAASAIEKGVNTILPTYFDVSFDFSPIHEHPIGWNEEGAALTPTFPYGVDLHTEEHKIDVDDIWNPPKANCDGMDPGSDEAVKCAAQKFAAEVEDALVQEHFKDRDSAQAALDNAEARYSGMFGASRFKKDMKKAAKQKRAGERIDPYIGSAIAGQRIGDDSGRRRAEARGRRVIGSSYAQRAKRLYDLE